MSQLHLYGPGYVSLNPPTEWRDVGVDATVNDSLVEAGINEQEFVFEGDAAVFIKNWIESSGFGTFNGIPYRIVYESNNTPANTTIRFDGFIDLYNFEYLSEEEPIRIKAPVKPINDPATVVENMAVMTQGLFIQKGYLNHTHYVDLPVIRESKKNVYERALVLQQFGTQVVQVLTQIINNMLSAISDVLGLSVLVGVVELLITFVNAVIMINKLLAQAQQIKDLFFPIIYYYKASSFKTILTQAYAYKGYTVDFGIADTWMSKAYIFASQNEFDGYPMQGFPATGELKPQDWGYIVGQMQETLTSMLDLRVRIIGTTVHIRPKKDPFWSTTPAYDWDDVLIKTAGPYNNGTTKFDTERVKATVMFNYAYDASDTHTLTAKSGDSYELHRELIVEQDPRFNTLKGIDEVNIPWAMAVRKMPFDNLWDLFTGISGEFDMYLDGVKNYINQFQGNINSSGVDVASQITTILGTSAFSTILANREGCLKIDDNAFAIPKIVWLSDYSVGKRIPTNFKDFIGAKAIYNDWHKWNSPADVSNFAGQYRLYNNVALRWGYEKFALVENNPDFDMDGYDAKFKFINWIEAKHSAVANIEQQKPFDENITEVEI